MTADATGAASAHGRTPIGGAALLLCVGSVAALVLSTAAPTVSGARRALAPDTLLAVLDALWVGALLWPRAGTVRDRWLPALLLLTVGLPFHLAVAAAAGAAPGHLAATGTLVGAAALTGTLAAGRPLYAPLLSLVALALPLSAYALAEFLRVESLWLVGASPLVEPVFLAHSAAVAPWDHALPAVIALLVVTTVSSASRPGSHARAGALVALGIGTCAAMCPAPAVAAESVEALFDGAVRTGRPVVVRAPDAIRVRADGGVWAGPVGVRGDEFVLLGATVSGDRLRVEVDRGGRSQIVDLDVNPLEGEGHVVASFEPPREAEHPVRAEGLPTVRDGWLVFDGLRAVPSALSESESVAAQSFADTGPRAFPFEPAMLPPASLLFRATATAQERAPSLPRRTAHVLVVLAVLQAGLLSLLRRARGAAVRDTLLTLAAPLVACAWLVGSDALPGAVRATALVLEGADDALVVLRVDGQAAEDVRVRPPEGASLVVPVRWDATDAAPRVQVGVEATLDLREAGFALVAYRVPREADATPGTPPTEAEGGPGWVEPVDDWLRRHGLRATVSPAGDPDVLPRIDGVPVVEAGRASISPR